jgi:hypothetical protein
MSKPQFSFIFLMFVFKSGEYIYLSRRLNNNKFKPFLILKISLLQLQANHNMSHHRKSLRSQCYSHLVHVLLWKLIVVVFSLLCVHTRQLTDA